MQSLNDNYAIELSSTIIPFIILLINNSDNRLFMEKLYLDHEKMLYLRAYAILGNKEDTEDAINNACIALIKKISLLRTFGCNVLSSYIVSTIEHVCINLANKRNRESVYAFKAADETISNIPADDKSPDDILIAAGESDTLYKAILALSDKERSMMQMKYFDGMSDVEIAKVFDIKHDSIRVYLLRARRHLKDILKEWNDNEE